jgi:multidrug efflux system outer membrane protein
MTAKCPEISKQCRTASPVRLPCRVIAAGLVFGMAACATKAPPTQEEILQQSGTLASMDLGQSWKAVDYSAEPIRDDWLATFQDPQLNDLVTEALANNLDLAVAATKVEQAEQYVELAKAALLPAINLIGTGGFNSTGGDASSALQGVWLGASWEPDLWGRLRYGRNAAQATYASVSADYEFSRQSLAASVARAWFTASETWLQARIANDMVEVAEQLLGLAELRWRIGPGNEREVMQARATVASLRDAAAQVELAHSQSVRALELLLGRYPAAELQARQGLTAMPGPIPAGFPLQILERRPDMVAAEQRVAAAFNRVGEAKAARLPSIVLNANVADISSTILELQEDFSSPSSGAGINLQAPIYTGGGLKTQVDIRTLEQKEAVADYASRALRALGDVENSLAASANLAARQALLEQAVADNQRALDLTQTSYRIGKSDLRAVQQQLLSLQSARQTLLRVESERLSQRTTLHLALGGSFEAPPAGKETGEPLARATPAE